jgi:hypothetical protein
VNNWRRWVRGCTLALIGASAAFGIFAIYEDFPQSSDQPFSVGFIQYSCPPRAQLHLVGAPMNFGVNINNDDSSYQAGLGLIGYSTGAAPCDLRLLLPSDAQNVTGARREGYYAVATMPLGNPSPVNGIRFINLSYSSRAGLQRTGWGRHSFTMRFLNGPLEMPWQPIPPHAMEGQSIGLTLSFSAPSNESSIVNYLPSAQADQNDASATWPVPPGGLAISYSVVFENTTIRFFADHAVDLVVVAVGALLGVLLATGEPQRARSEPADSPPEPAPATSIPGLSASNALAVSKSRNSCSFLSRGRSQKTVGLTATAIVGVLLGYMSIRKRRH